MTELPEPVGVGVGFMWGFVVAAYLLADVPGLALVLVVVSVAAYLYGFVFGGSEEIGEVRI